MANETKQTAERVILGPEHTAQDVLAFLLSGATDQEAARMWCMSYLMPDDDETLKAFEGMAFPFPIVAEINRKQRQLLVAQTKESVAKLPRAETKRVTVSPVGRIVLNGSIKTMKSAEGKGGIMPAYFPTELSQFVDDLHILLSGAIDKADDVIPSDATVAKESEETKSDRKRTGRKFDAKTDVSREKHPRAGQSAIDWTGCDKPATVAKLKRVLAALRNVKAE